MELAGCGLLGLLTSNVAFQQGELWLEALLGQLDRNRWLLLLTELLPAVGYVPPQGSFLAWLDFGALGSAPTRPPSCRSTAASRSIRSRVHSPGHRLTRLNIGTFAHC